MATTRSKRRAKRKQKARPRARTAPTRAVGGRKEKRPRRDRSPTHSRVAAAIAHFRQASTDAARAGQAVSDVADQIARAAAEAREDALVGKLAESRLLPDLLVLRDGLHEAAAAGTLPPKLRAFATVADGLLNFLRDELDLRPFLERGERVEVDAASASDFDAVTGEPNPAARGARGDAARVAAPWKVILRPVVMDSVGPDRS